MFLDSINQLLIFSVNFVTCNRYVNICLVNHLQMENVAKVQQVEQQLAVLQTITEQKANISDVDVLLQAYAITENWQPCTSGNTISEGVAPLEQNLATLESALCKKLDSSVLTELGVLLDDNQHVSDFFEAGIGYFNEQVNELTQLTKNLATTHDICEFLIPITGSNCTESDQN